MNDNNNKVVVIDTLAAAGVACARLRQHKVLALDMEGAPLGRVTSLLQLAASVNEVYVFDVLALGQELFDATHLLPILTNPSILKLCFDCRGDGHALFAQHGVRLQGVYDLQIVYTSLFQSAQDPCLKGLHRAIERISSICATTTSAATSATTKQQQLHGGDDNNNSIDARAFARRKLAIKRLWQKEGVAPSVLSRPLSADTIAYAAADVVHLLRMHQEWTPYVSKHCVVATSIDRMQRFIRLCKSSSHHHSLIVSSSSSASSSSSSLLSPSKMMKSAAASPPPCVGLPMWLIDFVPVRTHRRLCFVLRHAVV
jgi:hypothetical protein